jgi:biopolymer transport protein TolQ
VTVMPVPMLLLQVQGERAPVTLWGMVAGSSAMAKAVLVILALLSLVSWAIMIAKILEFRRARATGQEFMREFEHAHSLEEAAGIARRLPPSGFTRVFERAQQFLQETRPALGATPDRTARLSGSQVEALRLVLDATTNDVRDEMGRFVPWLAVIGSVSPLIGLLGTVLGVVAAFVGITNSGSGNLSAVAPGIAEALIATAAALAVAIPAVFGYNLSASRLNRLDSQLEGFGSELIALMVREGRI